LAIFLQDIEALYKHAEKVTLVMDNLSTHTPGSFYEVFPPSQAKALWNRFEFVYTPKHGSWLNMEKIEVNVLIGQCPNRRINNIEMVKTNWQHSRNPETTKAPK